MAFTITKKYKGLRCKICDGETEVLGVCDFNKTCEEEKKKKVFPFIGHSVYYHQCKNCQFIFTVDFDEWSIDDYLVNIYNTEYVSVDPDYISKRPEFCLSWFVPMLGGDKSTTVFDYGAGTNYLSLNLKQNGYTAEGWDPMWKTEPDFDKTRKFDVVTAFEVLEHTPTPYDTSKEMLSFLKPESGQVVFSTLVNDIIGDQGSDYWYIAPRNGHVCMHSNKSLEIMFDKLGLEVQHFSPSQHLASWKD